MEPQIATPPARPWGIGALLALAGSALAAISVSLAWGIQPAPQEVGLYVVNVSIPRLISRGASGNIPFLGFVVVTLAILAAPLVAVETSRWVELVRRALGVIVLALVVLFGYRYRQALEGLPPDLASFPGSLRVGFYLALAGSLFMALGGRSLRSSSTETPEALPEPVTGEQQPNA